MAEWNSYGTGGKNRTYKTYNTWETWRLIPESRPSVASPKPRTKMVDIPGMNGKLDISEILTGEQLYENRTGSWKFYITRDVIDEEYDYPSWAAIYHQIVNAINGKRGFIYLEDEPEIAYEGRFTVKNFIVKKDYSQVEIGYELNPAGRYDIENANDMNGVWKWDPFDFTKYVLTVESGYYTAGSQEVY